ncbi:Rv2253/PknI dimerization domain-containing protein [Mycobacterium sp. MMS18-G62]
MLGKVVAVGVAAAAAMTPGVSSADPSTYGPSRTGATDPVPLNGSYVVTRALDRQTFNGSPAPAIPFAAKVDFSTTCDSDGCVAHSSLVANGSPFDFRWTGAAWQTVQHFEWTCGDHSAPATVTYTLMPDSNGTLTGDRSASVESPGCGSAHLLGTVVSPLTAVPA